VGRGWLSLSQEPNPRSRPFGPRLSDPHSKISFDAVVCMTTLRLLILLLSSPTSTARDRQNQRLASKEFCCLASPAACSSLSCWFFRSNAAHCSACSCIRNNGATTEQIFQRLQLVYSRFKCHPGTMHIQSQNVGLTSERKKNLLSAMF